MHYYNFIPTMKYQIGWDIIFSISFLYVFTSCSNNKELEQKLATQQLKIDSMQKEINNMKPGLGELMAGIQTHHAKLWFAGTNQNWKLASFELDEIKEMVVMAEKIETDRPEIKSLPILQPSLDSIENSIQVKDRLKFISGFTILTSNCNKCHEENKFEFNVITIPSALPVSNQDFKPRVN